MAKDAFVGKLNALLAPEVAGFLNMQAPEELAHRTKIEDVRKQIETATVPEVAAALQGVLKSLEAKHPDATAARRKEAAQAVLEVVNALNLPLQVAVTVTPSTGGGKKRTPKDEMTRLVDTIPTVIPKDGELSLDEIAQKIQADATATRSALQRLKREGKVAIGGNRGRIGLWKLN